MLKPYYQTSSGRLYNGNCLEILQKLEEKSIHCCITSPPYYGLRDYGVEPQVWDGDAGCGHEWGDELVSGANDSNHGSMEWTTGGNPAAKVLGHRVSQGQFCQLCGAWRGSLGLEPTPELYIQHMVQIFAGVWRVLRDDGTLWVNIGDSFNGSGKAGRNPAYQERHTEFGKPSVHKERFGMPTRIPGLKPKDLVGIPWLLAFALRSAGWYLRSEIIWNKLNPLPESVQDRPTKSHEQIFLLAKSPKYFYDADAIAEESKWNGKSGNKNYREWSENGRENEGMNSGGSRAMRNKRSVWSFQTAQIHEPHFATFPTALVEPALLAGTNSFGCCSKCGKPWERLPDVKYAREYTYTKIGIPGEGAARGRRPGRMGVRAVSTPSAHHGCDCNADVVPCTILDPFFGSGTVGVVAEQQGRNWIGIELSEDYCAIAMRRLESSKMASKGMQKHLVKVLKTGTERQLTLL